VRQKLRSDVSIVNASSAARSGAKVRAGSRLKRKEG